MGGVGKLVVFLFELIATAIVGSRVLNPLPPTGSSHRIFGRSRTITCRAWSALAKKMVEIIFNTKEIVHSRYGDTKIKYPMVSRVLILSATISSHGYYYWPSDPSVLRPVPYGVESRSWGIITPLHVIAVRNLISTATPLVVALPLS